MVLFTNVTEAKIFHTTNINKYLLDALILHFLLHLQCSFIKIAEKFVVLLVWQHIMHTLPYFCKYVLVIIYATASVV
jgi:hypothetical protein